MRKGSKDFKAKKIKCLMCGVEMGANYLGTHLHKKHQSKTETYYLQYLAKEGAGKCEICQKPTKFRGQFEGYTKTCSRACGHKIAVLGLQAQHGEHITNHFQLESVKQKAKNTVFAQYGVENISQSQYAKDKKIETCFSNYGVDYPGQSEEVRKKAERTNIFKYGCANVMHNDEIAQRAAMSGGRASVERYLTKFGNEIFIQGSYEKRFVEYCERNDYCIFNGPTIKYIYDGVDRKYRIDFEVHRGREKILVEIKSTYWYNQFKDQVISKKKEALMYCEVNNLSYQLLIEKWELD